MLEYSPFFDHEKFCKHMKAWRRQHRLSLRAMEKMTGYSHASLSRMERGKQQPDLGFFMVLCRIMNLDMWVYYTTTDAVEKLRDEFLPRF